MAPTSVSYSGKGVPRGQFVWFLLVGAWNSLFGYSCYALLTALLQPLFRHGYIIAGGLSNLISITVSVAGYKLLVFKTKGNYWKEWSRSLVVYGGGILGSMTLLPVLVFGVRRFTPFSTSAPYIAGAMMMGVNAVYCFFGHRKFTFQNKTTNAPNGL